MRRSTNKILATHVGSLPANAEFDQADIKDEAQVKRAVEAVVKQQRDAGLDILNEGEYTKGGDWLSFIEGRFGGFEERPHPDEMPIIMRGKDRTEFADFYKYASDKGTLFYSPGDQMKTKRPYWVCTGPMTYQG